MPKEIIMSEIEEIRSNKLAAAVSLLVEKLEQSGIETKGKTITIKNNQVTVK